jgi:hypothetical protein
MDGRPASGPDTLTLSVVGTPNVLLLVNGKSVRFPAINLEDDRGGSYTLLNAPDNPLVVRLRFGRDAVVAGKRLTAASGGGYDVTAFRFTGAEANSTTNP